MPFMIERLKDIRLLRQFTQQDVAERVGVVQQQYSEWEKGKTTPSIGYIEKLSRELGVSIDYLLGLSDDPNEQMPAAELSEDERKLIALYRRGKRERYLINTLLDLSSSPTAATNEFLDEGDDEGGGSVPKPGIQGKAS